MAQFCQIYIGEDKGGIMNEFDYMTIPFMPDKISFLTNGTRVIEYDLMDIGRVEVPLGENVRGYKWTGFLPGEGMKDNWLISGYKWIEPKKYQETWSFWRSEGTPLKLVIPGTPINHRVYLYDYNVDYKGGLGNYYYTIEFHDKRDIKVTYVKKETPAKSETGSNENKPSASYRTYTVKKGDCLWSIARSQLGNELRYNEIYELNKDSIETTARKYGRSSSNNGWWIYPGEVLKLPN